MRALALAAALAACGHAAPKPRVEPIETIDVRRACLHNPHRPTPAVTFRATVGATCTPWAACYSIRDAVALAWYMRALERWIDAAIVDCGEPPAPAGKPGASS